MPQAAVGRHRCLVYEGHPAEQVPVLAPLIAEALREGRRCLYLGDPQMAGLVRRALADGGVAVAAEERRSALVFSSDRSHLELGFDPRRMLATLRRSVESAVADGFAGLWASGDMRWELGADENFERLREYEALLDAAFAELPLAGVCQYRRDMVPPGALLDALATHRTVYVDGRLCADNVFYLPPDLLLAAEASDRRLADWLWGQVARLVRAEHERDAALAALREANRDLEARVLARTKDLEAFSQAVSHDLRAPLRAIQGFAAQVLSPGSRLDGDGMAALARVQAAAGRMTRLIEGLSELYRVGGCALERAPVDLSALAEEALLELRVGERGRSVETVVAPGLKAVGDARLLSSLLQNLLGNAWKFTARNPSARIEFGARPAPEGPEFFVRDDGVGFDPARAQGLFKPFRRLHSPDEFPGSGLGLAIVERVVSRHGGRVWAEPGRPGAAFYFTLP